MITNSKNNAFSGENMSNLNTGSTKTNNFDSRTAENSKESASYTAESDNFNIKGVASTECSSKSGSFAHFCEENGANGAAGTAIEHQESKSQSYFGIEHGNSSQNSDINANFGKSDEQTQQEGSNSSPKATEAHSIHEKIHPDFFSEESLTRFKTDFPNVDPHTLKSDSNFSDLLSLLTKCPTLSVVYAYFNRVTASIEASSQQKILQAMANARSSVGSLASSSTGDDSFFTKEQVLKMSPVEVRKNFEKIRQSQSKW